MPNLTGTKMKNRWEGTGHRVTVRDPDEGTEQRTHLTGRDHGKSEKVVQSPCPFSSCLSWLRSLKPCQLVPVMVTYFMMRTPIHCCPQYQDHSLLSPSTKLLLLVHWLSIADQCLGGSQRRSQFSTHSLSLPITYCR